MNARMSAAPVKQSIVVEAPIERAFKVFTDGFDTWWPRSHHIGKQPMVKAVIESRAGGRCFGREADGTECDWGRVLTWEPPNRFVLAWQIGPTWQYEPDLNKASEVEVRFTAEPDGLTRVDLEHRHFERHGEGAGNVRSGVDTTNGWGGLLQTYAARATDYHPAVAPLALIFTINDSLATGETHTYQWETSSSNVKAALLPPVLFIHVIVQSNASLSITVAVATPVDHFFF